MDKPKRRLQEICADIARVSRELSQIQTATRRTRLLGRLMLLRKELEEWLAALAAEMLHADESKKLAEARMAALRYFEEEEKAKEEEGRREAGNAIVIRPLWNRDLIRRFQHLSRLPSARLFEAEYCPTQTIRGGIDI